MILYKQRRHTFTYIEIRKIFYRKFKFFREEKKERKRYFETTKREEQRNPVEKKILRKPRSTNFSFESNDYSAPNNEREKERKKHGLKEKGNRIAREDKKERRAWIIASSGRVGATIQTSPFIIIIADK